MAETTSIAEHVRLEIRDAVAILTLDRPQKRNALDSDTVEGLGRFFEAPPTGITAAVLTSSGDHFSAGLDLSELGETSVLEGVHHSRNWHRQFDTIQFGRLPVVTALRGAVIGGGLELALATHIRVAEPSAYYALPEGGRGIFVGGGASVRLPRVIGVHRMADMMLTGRVYDADTGHELGLTQYLVDDGEGLDKAMQLAEQISKNAPATNFAILQALPRITEMSPSDGLFVESLMASIAQGTDDAKQRMREFLAGRAAKVGGPAGESGSPNETA